MLAPAAAAVPAAAATAPAASAAASAARARAVRAAAAAAAALSRSAVRAALSASRRPRGARRVCRSPSRRAPRDLRRRSRRCRPTCTPLVPPLPSVGACPLRFGLPSLPPDAPSDIPVAAAAAHAVRAVRADRTRVIRAAGPAARCCAPRSSRVGLRDLRPVRSRRSALAVVARRRTKLHATQRHVRARVHERGDARVARVRSRRRVKRDVRDHDRLVRAVDVQREIAIARRSAGSRVVRPSSAHEPAVNADAFVC